jgi:hypothetical protein
MTYSHEAKIQLFDLLAKEPALPYVAVRRDILGGEARATILATVSLEASKDWPNGIFENSNYARFLLSEDKLELFSGGPARSSSVKFRKQRAASVEEAAKKIIAFARAWAAVK